MIVEGDDDDGDDVQDKDGILHEDDDDGNKDDDASSSSSPEEEVDSSYDYSPLRSADATFVLAFSTIMLQTDLHNPTLRDDRRMTVDEFVKNLRGIEPTTAPNTTTTTKGVDGEEMLSSSSDLP